MTILEHPLAQTVIEGNNLLLTCSGKGYPSIGITWFKDDKVVTNNVYRLDFSGDSTLNISSVSRNDAGSYICLFSTSAGNLNSSVAQVIVLCKLIYHIIIACKILLQLL